jgi:hypothetical protein
MRDQNKQRHGCLTAWLILMIIANSLTSLAFFMGSQSVRLNFPMAPPWAFPVLGALGVINLVCAIALFKWKKWGFFGFAASSIVAFVVNLMVGVPILQALLGIVGFVVLFAVLQIGTENKGWTQLE